MKENTINYRGIKTNNLKNIDVSIKKGTKWFRKKFISLWNYTFYFRIRME